MSTYSREYGGGNSGGGGGGSAQTQLELHQALAEESGTVMFLSAADGTVADLAETPAVESGDWATDPQVKNLMGAGEYGMRGGAWTTNNTTTALELKEDLVLRAKFQYTATASTGVYIVGTGTNTGDPEEGNTQWSLLWGSTSTLRYFHESGSGDNHYADFTLPEGAAVEDQVIYVVVRRTDNGDGTCDVEMWAQQGHGNDFQQMAVAAVSGMTDNGASETVTGDLPTGTGDVAFSVLSFDDGALPWDGVMEFAHLLDKTTTDAAEETYKDRVMA